METIFLVEPLWNPFLLLNPYGTHFPVEPLWNPFDFSYGTLMEPISLMEPLWNPFLLWNPYGTHFSKRTTISSCVSCATENLKIPLRLPNVLKRFLIKNNKENDPESSEFPLLPFPYGCPLKAITKMILRA